MKINVVILFLLAMSLSMTGERQGDTISLYLQTTVDSGLQLELERARSRQKLQELEKTLITNYELVPKNERK